MKKKIGEIYDKPIVIGDKNLVTENEIHVDELGGKINENNNTDFNVLKYTYDMNLLGEGSLKAVAVKNLDGSVTPLTPYDDLNGNYVGMAFVAKVKGTDSKGNVNWVYNNPEIYDRTYVSAKEFYTPKKYIKFFAANQTFVAEEGSTWKEFINGPTHIYSSFNITDTGFVVNYQGQYLIYNDKPVKQEDFIIANGQYTLSE